MFTPARPRVRAAPDSSGLGFTFNVSKSGDVFVFRQSRLVNRLRGAEARVLAAKLETLSTAEQQQLLARATGNYKRGNERAASLQPRHQP